MREKIKDIQDLQRESLKWCHRIKTFFKVFYETVLQLVFPRRCPVCDNIVVPYGEKICIDCLKKIRYITPPYCMKCGKKLDSDKEFCGDCKAKKHNFVRGRALYEYKSVADTIYRFKYSNRREYAEFLGEDMAYHLGNFISSVKPDMIIPVPLHKKREKKRGYNQAALLAKTIGESLSIPVREDIVFRVKNTIPLKKLNQNQRQNNLKKAFNIRENVVKLKTIIIIDDIYTTGSTIDEISSILLKAGASKVYFVTLSCGSGI